MKPAISIFVCNVLNGIDFDTVLHLQRNLFDIHLRKRNSPKYFPMNKTVPSIYLFARYEFHLLCKHSPDITLSRSEIFEKSFRIKGVNVCVNLHSWELFTAGRSQDNLFERCRERVVAIHSDRR